MWRGVTAHTEQFAAVVGDQMALGAEAPVPWSYRGGRTHKDLVRVDVAVMADLE